MRVATLENRRLTRRTGYSGYVFKRPFPTRWQFYEHGAYLDQTNIKVVAETV